MNLELVQKIQFFRERSDEVKRARAHLMLLEGKFNEEFGPWLKGLTGGKDQFEILDIIEKIYEISKS